MNSVLHRVTGCSLTDQKEVRVDQVLLRIKRSHLPQGASEGDAVMYHWEEAPKDTLERAGRSVWGERRDKASLFFLSFFLELWLLHIKIKCMKA